MPSRATNVLMAISMLCLIGYITGYAMPAAIGAAIPTPTPTLNQTDKEAAISATAIFNANFATSANYTTIYWEDVNTSTITNTSSHYTGPPMSGGAGAAGYVIIAGGGGGGTTTPSFNNSTPPTETPTTANDPANTTVENLFMQMTGPEGVGTTGMKIVILLGVIGVVITALMQLGFIPTFSHGRGEEQPGADDGAAGGAYAGGLTIGEEDDPHQPAQSTPSPEQEVKKPAKRDRYEVIKV